MNSEIVSKWCKDYNTFKVLVQTKDVKGLIDFGEKNQNYKQRVIRAVIEIGAADDLNVLMCRFSDIDYQFLLEAIVFFRKNDKDFLMDCAEHLNNITDAEADFLMLERK